MSEAEPEVMAEYFNKIQRQTELLKTKLNEQPIPLPTVPANATCGGCRWWAPENWCHVEPELHQRDKTHYACHRYQEAAK